MKKLILLFIFISSYAKAQTTTPSLALLSTSSDTVNYGDTLTINFEFYAPTEFPWDYISVHLYEFGSSSLNEIYHTEDFYSLDTFPIVSISGHDTIHAFKLYINHTFEPDSNTVMSHCWNPAHSKVYFYIRPIVDTSTVWINTYSISKTIKETHYYTELGQEIQKPNESTSGLVIFRILYTDGSVEVKKKYYLSH